MSTVMRTSTSSGAGSSGGTLPKKPSEIIAAQKSANAAKAAASGGSSNSAVAKVSAASSGSSGSGGQVLAPGDIAKTTGPANTPSANLKNGNVEKAFPKTTKELRRPISEDIKKNKTLSKKLDVITDPVGAAKKKMDDTKKKATKKLDNSIKILDKAGADIIKSAKTQALDLLNSVLVIPEPVLLATLKVIASKGGDPAYSNYYSLTEMIKKDYKSIVQWMVEDFGMSPVSGKSSAPLNRAASLRATKCAIYVLDKKRELKGEDWFRTNRYTEFKKITKSCKTNFSKSLLMDAMNRYGIATSGLGEKGCTEFGIRYNYTLAEVNMFLPEKKKALYCETYPLSTGHVDLFNAMLDGNTPGIGPEAKLTHKIIYKRLRQNVVVTNPIVGIISGAADSIIKETGVDKIVNLATHPEQLMMLYIKDIKKKGLL
jgi:hypothetical protein